LPALGCSDSGLGDCLSAGEGFGATFDLDFAELVAGGLEVVWAGPVVGFDGALAFSAEFVAEDLRTFLSAVARFRISSFSPSLSW